MEWVTNLIEVINSNLAEVIGILAVLGIAVDLTPVIKVQPVRFILRWIGKYLNKDFTDELAAVKERLETTEKTLNAHIIDVQRHDILSFANDLINQIPHTKEEFDYIIEVHNQYLKNISAGNIENGRVDVAYRIIEEDYMNNISNNSFLRRGEKR